MAKPKTHTHTHTSAPKPMDPPSWPEHPERRKASEVKPPGKNAPKPTGAHESDEPHHAGPDFVAGSAE